MWVCNLAYAVSCFYSFIGSYEEDPVCVPRTTLSYSPQHQDKQNLKLTYIYMPVEGKYS